jgi:hypothetical protein
MAEISNINVNGTTYDIVDDEARCVVMTIGSINSLPVSVGNTKITADHVVVNSVLSNPSAQTGDWTVTTTSGQVSISGSISGTTNITLYLIEQR